MSTQDPNTDSHGGFDLLIAATIFILPKILYVAGIILLTYTLYGGLFQ